jgi:hypothetical protein
VNAFTKTHLATHSVVNCVRVRGGGRAFTAALAMLAALVAAVPSTANAVPPRRVGIIALFSPITFGEVTFVNGRLVGTGQAGQPVALEQSPPPFTDWTPIQQITSDASGFYSFELRPSDTMEYRATAQGTPSRAVQIAVAPRITFKARPVGTSSVRFSGTFGPARPGELVAIQRRSSTGAWTTISSAGLGTGTVFRGRLRAHYRITLRAFYSGDDQHLAGHSNAVTVVPRWKGKPHRTPDPAP